MLTELRTPKFRLQEPDDGHDVRQRGIWWDRTRDLDEEKEERSHCATDQIVSSSGGEEI